MIRARTLLALLVGLPLAVSGQSGAVRYDQSTRIDIKLPPELARNPEVMANMGNIPKSSTRPMQLRFTPQAALFGPAPVAPLQALRRRRDGHQRRRHRDGRLGRWRWRRS